MELFLWALVAVPDKDLIENGNVTLVHGDPTSMTKNITFDDVIPMYKDMVNEWNRILGEDIVAEMLVSATTGDVDFFVAKQPQNILVNVMGHTHKAALHRVKRQANSNSTLIYANSGAWVDTAINTWVDVIYNGSTPTTVQIGSYDNGTERLIGTCMVGGNTPCKFSAGWSLTLGVWSLVSLVLSFLHFVIWSL